MSTVDRNGWLSIEGAAKDDTPRLLWNGHWRGVGWYQEPYHGEFAAEFNDPVWVDETGDFIEPSPTHFQPLPEPPETP